MGTHFRNQWCRARSEALRVEMLEERRLLNGRGDWAGRGFVADGDSPDGETPSGENAAEVENGDKSEAESDEALGPAPGGEIEHDDRGAPVSGNLVSNHEPEDADAKVGHETVASATPAAGNSNAIQSFEDDQEQAPISQPSGGSAGSPVTSASVTTSQVSGGSSTVSTGQVGNTTSTSPAAAPATATIPTANGQSQTIEIDEAEEAFEVVHVAQAAGEPRAVSATRSPVARQAAILTQQSEDLQAEATRLPVATRAVEAAATEPAAKRDSATATVAPQPKSADSHAAEQAAPAPHVAGKANPNTDEAHNRETIDSSERVESSSAPVESISLKSLVALSAPLISTQLPVAAIVDAALATPPQMAGLLTDFISIDMVSIELEIDSILGQIDGLRRELGDSLTELNLPTWLLAAAVGAAAAEVVRLQWKRLPSQLAAVVSRDGSSSTWLPDSAGPAPEELP